VDVSFAGPSLRQAFQQAPGVGRHPEKERCLHERVVVGSGQQHGVAALGRDLDGLAVVVDLLDEGEQIGRAAPLGQRALLRPTR